METFQSIGFWREFHNNALFPSIFDSIKNTSILEEKKQILSFLKSGKYVLGRYNEFDCPIFGGPMYPVRSGLVEKAHHYLYSSAGDYDLNKKGLLEIEFAEPIGPIKPTGYY
ncbi:MAG: hypothetical protein JNL70_16360 [Saprospiraceae bacterium]|nr:hypothetical protein [Saprospiraceae bacterium]